jgi:hypothetical protein
MKIRLLLLLTALLSACASSSDTPAVDRSGSDEFQIETTVLAMCNVISGPAGRRDWNRFEALFAPGAAIIDSRVDSGAAKVAVMTVKEYVEVTKPLLNDKGWFEKPVATNVQRFGNIAHVWSTYEGRAAANAERPDIRGINSFEMVKLNGEWKIQTLVSQAEDPVNPIPPEYQPHR